MRWLQSAQRTTVRLGLDFYDTAPWIVAVAGDTGADHRVDVVRIPYGQLPEVLERRTVDLAVDLLPADADPGDAHQLVDDDLVGVVATGDPAADRGELCPADVAETYYLTAGETPTHGFEHSEFMVPAGVEPREVVRIESAAVVLRMIAAGRGITILPRLAVTEADVAEVTVVDLAGPHVPVRWVVRTRTDPIDATLQVIADLQAAAAAGGGCPGAQPTQNRPRWATNARKRLEPRFWLEPFSKVVDRHRLARAHAGAAAPR